MPGSIRSRTTRSGRCAAARASAVGAVGGPVHEVSGPVEVAGDDLGDGGVVVDDEDAGAGPVRGCCCLHASHQPRTARAGVRADRVRRPRFVRSRSPVCPFRARRVNAVTTSFRNRTGGVRRRRAALSRRGRGPALGAGPHPARLARARRGQRLHGRLRRHRPRARRDRRPRAAPRLRRRLPRRADRRHRRHRVLLRLRRLARPVPARAVRARGARPARPTWCSAGAARRPGAPGRRTPGPGNLALARLLRRRTGLRLHDLGPLRAARREPLLALGLTDRRSGYPLQMVVRAADAGWRIAEHDVPVPAAHRRLQGDGHLARHLAGGAGHEPGPGRTRRPPPTTAESRGPP